MRRCITHDGWVGVHGLPHSFEPLLVATLCGLRLIPPPRSVMMTRVQRNNTKEIRAAMHKRRLPAGTRPPLTTVTYPLALTYESATG